MSPQGQLPKELHSSKKTEIPPQSTYDALRVSQEEKIVQKRDKEKVKRDNEIGHEKKANTRRYLETTYNINLSADTVKKMLNKAKELFPNDKELGECTETQIVQLALEKAATYLPTKTYLEFQYQIRFDVKEEDKTRQKFLYTSEDYLNQAKKLLPKNNTLQTLTTQEVEKLAQQFV